MSRPDSSAKSAPPPRRCDPGPTWKPERYQESVIVVEGREVQGPLTAEPQDESAENWMFPLDSYTDNSRCPRYMFEYSS